MKPFPAPPSEAGGGSFGPRLQGVAGRLVGRYRLSRREAVLAVAELGAVARSLGAVAHLEQATSAALAPVVDAVAQAVRQAAAANLDEAGWWQGHRRAWLWTMVTETLTLFGLDPTRAGAVARERLGPDWAGIVGSDCYAAYRWLPLEQRQRCWAHLIREFRKLTTSHRHQAPLGPRLLDLGDRIFAAWHRFRADMIDRPTRQAKLTRVE